MKTPDKILDDELTKLKTDGFIRMFYAANRQKIIDIISNIQKDAYNQAIDDAVENAEIEYKEGGFMRYGDMKWIDTSDWQLNEESILKLKINESI